MGSLRSLEVGVILLLAQAFRSGFCEEGVPCQPSFGSEVFEFSVHRRHLHMGTRLGKVHFDDCGGDRKVLFRLNSHIEVDSDGTVRLKKPVELYGGERHFTIAILGSKSESRSATVRVVHVRKHGHGDHHQLHHHELKHHHHHTDDHQQSEHSEVDGVPEEHSAALPQLPHSSKGLKRRKRDWVIPPISVSENERGPFPKLMVQIRSSRDKEVKVQYSITGPGADQPPVGLFTINRDTGWLSVTQPLDREKEDKYKLVAHAVALGDSASRAEDPMEIIIKVIDQNDNRPEFTMDPFLGNVAESSPKGFEFMKVTAIDKDEPGSANADIRYKLLIQNPESPKADMFFINPSTGGIQINSDGLDRENFPKYTLIIQAADMMGEGLATTCTAIVTVTDSNDNAPQFVHSSHSAALPQPVFPHSSRNWDWVIPPISVSENERGPFPKLMVQIRYSRDKEVKVQYSITGPGADQPPVGLFTINRDTGWLSVTQPLDREKNDKYKLLAHAVALGDSASRAEDPMEIIINVIDQNDNRPEFTMDPFLGNVAESSPKGFEFMKVTAIDKDKPGSANADIRYKLLTQNPESPKADMFFINPSTGGIQLNSDGLDRENFPKYTLIIQAADMMGEGLATTCTAIVTVTDSNDNAPQFVHSSHSAALPQPVFPHSSRNWDWVIPPISVSENERGPFPKLMVQIRYSRDKEVKVQYSITGPGADQPPVGLFTINRDTGWLSVTQPLDREKNDKYKLLAHAVALGDSASRAEDPMEIIINVIDQNDNRPEFTMDPFLGNVAESSPKGFEFMKVTAIDKDKPGSANADIRYKLLTQNPESPKADMFFINPSTGGIQLNSDGLDRENFPKYTLIIQAADMMGEGLATTCTAIVTVTDSNDNAPQFVHSSHSAALPQPVFPHSSRNWDWVIPPISVSENERGPFPKLMVQIRYSRDKEVKVQYSITGPGADQPPVGLFTINRDTGWLSVTQPLDREKNDKYKLLAHAVALGDSASRAEDPVDITINVIDQNDNRPEFTMGPFLGNVAESSPKGFEFMKVTAIDKDEPGSANADIRYKLLIQNPESPKADMFFINPSTGGIQLNSDGLDRENFPKYTLIIQAADMMGEGLATTCTAIVTVTDNNDNAPQFVHSSHSAALPQPVFPHSSRNWDWVIPPISVSENERGPFPKLMVQIRYSRDKEVKVQYSITGPGADQPPVGLFTINRDTGWLSVTQPLDREKNDKYILLAHAVALGDSASRAEDPVDITINVIDQNDNRPEFTMGPFLGNVAESSPKGFEFMKVTAIDKDEPGSANADIRYKLLIQNPESPKADMFFINPSTGGIQLNSDGLDRENFPKYTLIIQAADMMGEGLATTCTAIVTVTDSNDNAPQFVHSSHSAALPQLVFPHSFKGLKRRKRDWVIPPISVPENDRGPFPKFMVEIRSSRAKEVKVQYSITGPGADQPPVGLFIINRENGRLSVTQPLDREKNDTYILLAHADALGDSVSRAEDPMDIVIKVIDQNDNSPEFTMDPFLGNVAESSPKGFEFMKVTAIDKDEPGSENADIRYKLLTQNPESPKPDMFFINPSTGGIQLNTTDGLDRENFREYTLIIQAADMMGEGRRNTCTAIVTVTDSNDNAPQFEHSSYTVSVPENEVGAEVVKMPVTDRDDPHTPAWTTKYRIIEGNNGGFFNVSTGPSKLEGIITTVKGLDFEKNAHYTLLVTVENDAPFATRLPTSTATVIVNVKDVNEAPVFNPVERVVIKPENLEVDADIIAYTATDPDTARNQKVWYKSGYDPAGWLNVNKETGLIKVRSPMDRESPFVIGGKYRALINAIDNDDIPATGTGTLLIELEDVNDNAPIIEERTITICNQESQPVTLSVSDRDGPGFAAPFRAELQGDSGNNWTARMNGTKTGIILALKTHLEQNDYNVILRVYDSQGMYQDSTVQAKVCDCKGDDFTCNAKAVAGVGLPGILGILGAILLLLLLVLLLLMFLRRRSRPMKEEPLLHNDVRDNLYYYDEEGGGEEDQDYDLSQLHRGLDNRPDVMRDDVAPTFLPVPQYRTRPTNPEDIGNFIDDNLKAADGDPTAPPYDSLLVFDYEGGGSEAGSLSSLNSSSSGEDQDYDCLAEWGPRFKKLADMYGGGED
ncbi:protocadherin Fat 4-like isoform X1 [Anguilla anguilla]|uniref:protocadherin Fat 4-like isoform X1 n=1 Tax=Anguilla anguilla TaxID=7936 RepID=UPI0015AD16D5|nr:protocadherin Fat 4-like isoform X1 [Anguilla anguilla]